MFSTDYKRLKILREMGYFILPEKITFGYREAKDRTGFIDNVTFTGEFNPLRKVLSKFFEFPNVFIKTYNHMLYLQLLNDDFICSILQSKYWKDKLKNNKLQTRIVIPLVLYEYDFETGSCLGSRSGIHKLRGLYAYIPCLPPMFSSKLQ